MPNDPSSRRPQQLPPVAQLMMRFGIAAQHYNSLLEKRLAPHGLTPLQLSVLSHLTRHPQPQPITEIASAVDAGQPAISKMVAKFATAGWVTQTADQNDKRIKHIKITPTGSQHLLQTQKNLMPDITAALQNWDDTEMAQFTADLKKFADILSPDA